MTTEAPQDVLRLIRETNDLIEDIKKLAQDENSEPQRLEKQMDKLTKNVEQLRAHPADTWQQARNDIMGLAGNLDAMQKTLTSQYEKAKQDLTSLSHRAQAEKSYAAYTPAASAEDAEKPAPDNDDKTRGTE